MASIGQLNCYCLVALSLLLVLVTNSSMETLRRSKRSVETDPSLTSYDDYCPNGLIAYEKFDNRTGVFGCAIKTAEVCYALCSARYANNWDTSNTVPKQDRVERDKWYCRSWIGKSTKPCYFKPKADIANDVNLAEKDPSLTSYDDDCPNGLIAYEKFNRETGVFDCAIKTAEICHALCSMVYSNNWDISNPLTMSDSADRDKWYCRSLPGYPTRPCYFKPKADIARDVAIMYSNS